MNELALQDEAIVKLETVLPKTLVLVPDLAIAGGVSNYYKTLKLDAYQNITYFTINELKPQSVPVAVVRLFRKYVAFSTTLLKNKYEIVVVNPSLDEGKSFYRDMIFILLTHLFKSKTIVFFRGWFDPFEERIRKSKFKSFLFNLSYARAGRYIVLGKIFKQKLLSLGVPLETKFNIETTVADSGYLKDLDLQLKQLTYERELKFLFLSRIEKEKGVFIAIDAFAAFNAKHPHRNASLVIAGDGKDLPEVKEYVSKNGLLNIEFLGHVSKDTKKKVLLDCHIMIFPSFTEGLPNVILEGMLYGMPIVARATGGIPEVVEEGVNGFVTESFEPAVFTDLLQKVSLDSSYYRSISEVNHQKAMESFTSEKVRERIISIYADAKAY